MTACSALNYLIVKHETCSACTPSALPVCVCFLWRGGGIEEPLMELFAQTGASSTGVQLPKEAAEREFHSSRD